MAWTAPLTAVTNATFTAAQFNASIRDNLLETMPGKATVANSIFVGTGTNGIAARTPARALDDPTLSGLTVSSTTYINPSGLGPAVSVVTGTTALVTIATEADSTSGVASNTQDLRCAYAISGATTVTPTDARGIGAVGLWWDTTLSKAIGLEGTFLQTGLTPGTNTFAMNMKVSAGTGFFANNRIMVLPL